MENYVSYHKIIEYLSNYQKSQQGIGLNSFGHGDLVYFSMNESGMTPTYPYMFVVPGTVEYDMNTTSWGLQILFADRINDDFSNEIDVISDMSIQAKRFISYIQRGMNQTPSLYNVMDCEMPVTSVSFLERFRPRRRTFGKSGIAVGTAPLVPVVRGTGVGERQREQCGNNDQHDNSPKPDSLIGGRRIRAAFSPSFPRSGWRCCKHSGHRHGRPTPQEAWRF